MDGDITYGQADDDESIATIHEAIDLGVTFFDAAEMYGPFSNEERVGEAIRGKRDGLVIATELGFRFEGRAPLRRTRNAEGGALESVLL